jgi:hypothetical protein
LLYLPSLLQPVYRQLEAHTIGLIDSGQAVKF